MAVSKAVESSKMVLRVQSGLDAAGKAVYKNVSLNGLNPAAADADVYDAANALGGLQKDTVASVLRVDQGHLTNA